jgi:hypothetical protein
MRVLKRVLTRKSILGYGYSDVRDLSVQMILDLGRENTLIKSYFNLEKIDFTEDILNELGITSEFRLVKPIKDVELGLLFIKHKTSNLSDEERIKYWQKVNSEKKNIIKRKYASNYSVSSEYLRSKNHGKR